MKKTVVLLLFVLYWGYSFACSTFLLSKNGRHVFGRNYDWVTGNGMILVNARGVTKTSFVAAGGESIQWVSQYGSITFNQFGKEFPHGGMNERGLVVELMWLHETVYPKADKRTGINVLQWVQYQLDNCATIADVIATDKQIRITSESGAPLHFLIADASGQAATIEFIDGKMVTHHGSALKYPVLTNTIYSEALQQVDRSSRASYRDNSVERFAKACQMVQQYREQNISDDAVDYSFKVLNKIAQGKYTKWSIVYDITNRQIYFTANGQRQRRQIGLNDVDFTCGQPPPGFSLFDKRAGNISKYLTELSYEQNKIMIDRSAQESAREIELRPEALAEAAEYFKKVGCKDS